VPFEDNHFITEAFYGCPVLYTDRRMGKLIPNTIFTMYGISEQMGHRYLSKIAMLLSYDLRGNIKR
jgi:hypothetical protein